MLNGENGLWWALLVVKFGVPAQEHCSSGLGHFA